MSSRRTAPQTATLLDRACWLLARQPALWDQLSAEAHDLLHAQPIPYGPYFNALERTVHEHGTMAFAAVLEEIEREPRDDSIVPLIQRLRHFHDVADDDQAEAMAAVLHRLRQQAVDDELHWLIESGELSETARQRRDQLLALRAQLKFVPPQTPSSR